MEQMSVRILGARGSVPVSGPEYRLCGGTSACLIRAGEEWIVWDAGSGLMAARDIPANVRVTLLLSHAHVDHLLALPMFPPLYSGQSVTIWGQTREGRDIASQVGALMAPPLWPVDAQVFSSGVRFAALPQGPIQVGDVTIQHMEGCHPGGCTVYAVSRGGVRAVFAVDYEHGTDTDEALCAFAKGCQLLLYDGHYPAEAYPAHVGWGHSTAEAGIALARRCGAKQLVICHHGPDQTDAALTAREARLQQAFSGIVFARENLELCL